METIFFRRSTVMAKIVTPVMSISPNVRIEIGAIENEARGIRE